MPLGDVRTNRLPPPRSRSDKRYDWQPVFKLYLTDYQEALVNRWAPPPDGLPDPEADDSPLNYHLEAVDLIGMCAKGDNKVTEDFALGLFSLPDILEVLTETPQDWGKVPPREQLPLLMRSPFLRLLHGIFFSLSAEEQQVACARCPLSSPENTVTAALTPLCACALRALDRLSRADPTHPS